MRKLAVDIGGPIIQRPAHSTLEEYKNAANTTDSFASLYILKKQFEDNIHLISQCNKDLQAVKLAWMEKRDFCNTTGVSLDRIHFVRQPQDKANLCKELGITDFVEDRAEILNHALGYVAGLYLFRPNVEEALNYPVLLKNCRVVLNWDSLTHFLTQ